MNPLLNQPFIPQQQPVPNNQNGIAQKLKEFSSMIQGDPKQIVQNLINSGKMSREQFQQYAQTANQILGR